LRWRTDRELDEEVQAHLDLEIESNLERGLSREEALRAARRTMGNLTILRERTREADPFAWLESVRRDIRYGLRNFARAPGFAVTTVLLLGLGIGANTAIFTVIDAALLRSLPVKHPEELLMLTQVGEGSKDWANFSNALWEQLRGHQGVFAELFAYASTRVEFSSGGLAHRVPAGFVSGGFFSTLGVHAAAGRTLTEADDAVSCPNVAVISHSFWQNEYGGAGDAVGRPITLDGHSFRIVGVIDRPFFGLIYGYHVPLWVPSCTERLLRGAVGGSMGRMVMGRPKPGAGLEQVRAQLAAMSPALFESTIPPDDSVEERARYRKTRLGAIPLLNGIPDLGLDYGLAFWVLQATAGLVLLIACANVANLLLARATARHREIAVRLALGASRSRIVRQLLTESLLLALAGAAIGLLFANWGSRSLVSLLSTTRNTVSLDLTPDARILWFTAAVGILTGVLFGLAAARRGAHTNPHAAMKAGGRGMTAGGSRFRFGKALTAAQVALSLVSVVGASLLLGSWRRLVTANPGFRSTGVLVARVNARPARIPEDQRGLTYRRLLERLRTVPGVTAASAEVRTPIDPTSWNTTLEFAGSSAGAASDIVELNEVSEGYFATLGIRLLSGRDFAPGDLATSPKVAIVNQELARRMFTGGMPIGQRFRLRFGAQWSPPVEIVGVAENTKQNNLREADQPIVYLALNQDTRPEAAIQFTLRTSRPPPTLIPAVKAAVAEIEPRASLDLATLQAQLDDSSRLPCTLGLLSGSFGALALLLSSVGLYGVMAYTVAGRRKEIGVRIALGAGRTGVIRMVMGDAARIISAGIVIGTFVSAAVARLVSQFLFGVEPNDPSTLAAGMLTLVAIGLTAAILPALRAARLNPVEALRED
jgi:predicted permease